MRKCGQWLKHEMSKFNQTPMPRFSVTFTYSRCDKDERREIQSKAQPTRCGAKHMKGLRVLVLQPTG